MKKYAVLILVMIILSVSLIGCDVFSTPTKKTISLDCDDEIVMTVGSGKQLSYTTKNLTGTATWKSTDTSIVDVNSAGRITAKKVGTAMVTVTVAEKSDNVIVNVIAKSTNDDTPPIVEETITVSLSVSRTSVFVDETVTLSATVTPSKYQNQVSYHLEDTTKASIDGNILSALSAGSVKVYAQVKEEKSESVEITISEKATVQSISLSSNKTQLKIGETATLSATATPSQFSDYVEYVIVSGTEYASLNQNTLSALNEGTVTVIAQIGDVKSNVITITIEGSTIVADSVKVRAQNYYVTVGESTTLSATVTPSAQASFVSYSVSDESIATITNNNVLKTLKIGDVNVTASVGGTVSEAITIHVVATGGTPTSISLSTNKTSVTVGQYATLSYSVYPTSSAKDIEYYAIEGENNVEIVGEKVYVLSKAPVKIVGHISGVITTSVIEINPNTMTTDPYTSYSSESKRNSFHGSGYTEATCLQDAEYRSDHFLMSGDLTVPDQEPTIAKNQPQSNGKYYRNTTTLFLDNGKTYIVFDVNGKVANIIYKGGAYITLEDVAAYVMAFGDVPANYDSNKKAQPSSSSWKKYLRVNHSYFKGDTSQYPYEPVLPNISGCGGSYSYYELDIGTTGTDCDPDYSCTLYNNGSSISRGAARIVYSKYTSYSSSSGGTEFTDINDRYVFYTYNHYNDFQEYLNYENGWGEMFGNITGGGTISSETDYNPTSYVKVLTLNFLANSFN